MFAGYATVGAFLKVSPFSPRNDIVTRDKHLCQVFISRFIPTSYIFEHIFPYIRTKDLNALYFLALNPLPKVYACYIVIECRYLKLTFTQNKALEEAQRRFLDTSCLRNKDFAYSANF